MIPTIRGFTLIELLIIIAIIGVLASVILGSLSDARDEGIDAKIKSELSVLGKQARIEELKSLTFDVVCGSNGIAQAPTIINIITAIERFSPEAVVCNSNSDIYAVSAATGSSTYWCVDSEGHAKDIPDQLIADTDFVCP